MEARACCNSWFSRVSCPKSASAVCSAVRVTTSSEYNESRSIVICSHTSMQNSHNVQADDACRIMYRYMQLTEFILKQLHLRSFIYVHRECTLHCAGALAGWPVYLRARCSCRKQQFVRSSCRHRRGARKGQRSCVRHLRFSKHINGCRLILHQKYRPQPSRHHIVCRQHLGKPVPAEAPPSSR